MKKILGWLIPSIIGIALAIWLGRPPKPDPKLEAERKAQDSAVAAIKKENLQLRQVNADLKDTARVHREGEDRAKAISATKSRKLRFLEDSLVKMGRLIRPAGGGPPIPVALTQADSARELGACLQRYEILWDKSASDSTALSECDKKAAADSARADTLAWQNAKLVRTVDVSDSLRKAEINRRRPCVRDLLVAHPACWKVDVAHASFWSLLLIITNAMH